MHGVAPLNAIWLSINQKFKGVIYRLRMCHNYVLKCVLGGSESARERERQRQTVHVWGRLHQRKPLYSRLRARSEYTQIKIARKISWAIHNPVAVRKPWKTVPQSRINRCGTLWGKNQRNEIDNDKWRARQWWVMCSFYLFILPSIIQISRIALK